jgi:hypothetical protein
MNPYKVTVHTIDGLSSQFRVKANDAFGAVDVVEGVFRPLSPGEVARIEDSKGRRFVVSKVD